MRAFVAGASGYTGQAVVRELCTRGIETTAHLRPESAKLLAQSSGFQAMDARVAVASWTSAAIEQALKDAAPDLVFALLGTTRARARAENLRGDIYQQVEGKLTAMLLDATAKVAPNARFVFLSALGTTSKTNNPYLRARFRTEQAIEASGLSYTIARPAFVTGPDRDESRPLERVTSIVVDGALNLLGTLGAKRLRARYSSLTAEELGKALVNAACDGACDHRVLNAEELRARSAESN